MMKNKPYRHLTIVIKLGTSSIVHEQTHQPLLSLLSSVAETVVTLRRDGHRVVIVSSGAVGVGMRRMGVKERGKTLSNVQALAAVGQGRLIALWDQLFTQLEQPIAQILLTRGEVSDRTRYINACNTFAELLSMGVVPIVNENDTVAVSEIRFGDNDTLSAITAAMIHADYLFLMTDVDCLYTANPRKDPTAQPVLTVSDVALIRQQISVKSTGTALGTGGMETKLIAAELAAGAGVTTIVSNSKRPENILSIIAFRDCESSELVEGSDPLTTSMDAPRPPHTMFLPKPNPLGDRKWWILHGLRSAGIIMIDEGAHRALSRRESGGRLLAAGVLGVQGLFASQQAVAIVIRRKKHVVNDQVPDPNAHDTAISQPSTPGAYTPVVRPGTPVHTGSSTSLDGLARLTQHASTSASTPAVPLTAQPPNLLDDSWETVEVGKGLANYNSSEIDKIKGVKSSMIEQILGYADSEHVVMNITLRVLA